MERGPHHRETKLLVRVLFRYQRGPPVSVPSERNDFNFFFFLSPLYRITNPRDQNLVPPEPSLELRWSGTTHLNPVRKRRNPEILMGYHLTSPHLHYYVYFGNLGHGGTYKGSEKTSINTLDSRPVTRHLSSPCTLKTLHRNLSSLYLP